MNMTLKLVLGILTALAMLLLMLANIKTRIAQIPTVVKLGSNAGMLKANQITSSPSGVGLTVYLHSRGSRP
jgi:hypothetical protein